MTINAQMISDQTIYYMNKVCLDIKNKMSFSTQHFWQSVTSLTLKY